jgi:hypothetical protein
MLDAPEWNYFEQSKIEKGNNIKIDWIGLTGLG